MYYINEIKGHLSVLKECTNVKLKVLKVHFKSLFSNCSSLKNYTYFCVD